MYDVGDVVSLGFTVTDAGGALADATTVTLTIGLPDGTTTTPVVQNPEMGRYTATFLAVLEGRHTVSWVATGTNARADADVFNVREIGDQLVSLAEAKAQLGATTATHEEQLRMFIAAAGRAVENHVSRVLVRRTFTEKHRGVSRRILLNRIPVLSVTAAATVDGTYVWNANDLDLDGDIGRVASLSGSSLSGDVTITYVAGMRVIPANYLLACRIITEHLWQTMRPFSSPVVPAVGALNDSLEVRAGGLAGFAIPNRAVELLGPPPPLVA
jgi:hypothetical protein